MIKYYNLKLVLSLNKYPQFMTDVMSLPDIVTSFY